MTDDQITQRQTDAFERFMKLLPPDQDLTLVILKGHLLIEEQIRQIIAERMNRPEVLEAVYRKGRIGFEVATHIAEAFFPKETEPWVWKAARKLNIIRNAISHSVEPHRLDTKIDDFVDSVGIRIDITMDRQERFEWALFVLFEGVSFLVDRRGSK